MYFDFIPFAATIVIFVSFFPKNNSRSIDVDRKPLDTECRRKAYRNEWDARDKSEFVNCPRVSRQPASAAHQKSIGFVLISVEKWQSDVDKTIKKLFASVFRDPLQTNRLDSDK